MEEKINNFKNFDPLTQLTLYGYSKYFNFFSNLFLKGELPQVNLISGKKYSFLAEPPLHFQKTLKEKNLKIY